MIQTDLEPDINLIDILPTETPVHMELLQAIAGGDVRYFGVRDGRFNDDRGAIYQIHIDKQPYGQSEKTRVVLHRRVSNMSSLSKSEPLWGITIVKSDRVAWILIAQERQESKPNFRMYDFRPVIDEQGALGDVIGSAFGRQEDIETYIIKNVYSQSLSLEYVALRELTIDAHIANVINQIVGV